MKIGITGSTGMLGSDLTKVLEEDNYSVLPIKSDIRDFWKIRNEIGANHPQVIIHCAAYTDVAKAEKFPKEAYEVNAKGTANVARLAESLGARLFVISTDYVFDGRNNRNPYEEFDTPNPINEYGKSKLLGEQLALINCKNTSIIRTQLLYGKSKENIVSKFASKALNNEMCFAVCDQWTSPTYTLDLAYKIRELVKVPINSIYHISGEGGCSIYELAKEIYCLLGADWWSLITPIEYHKRPVMDGVRRPLDSILSGRMLEIVGLSSMRDWMFPLREYLEEWQ